MTSLKFDKWQRFCLIIKLIASSITPALWYTVDPRLSEPYVLFDFRITKIVGSYL